MKVKRRVFIIYKLNLNFTEGKMKASLPVSKINVMKLARPFKEDNYRATMGNFGKWVRE